jgi:hypothetical protein
MSTASPPFPSIRPSLPKAQSVREDGTPDAWTPPNGYRAQVAPDGATRLVISVGAEQLPAAHLALLGVLGDRLSIRYVQLTDRAVGQLPKAVSWVGMVLPADKVLEALHAARRLVWEDGRHQLWIRGEAHGEQVVLDELGVLYTYPDDVGFRDALDALGLPLTNDVGIDGRDYVKVQFLAEADAEEAQLIRGLNLRQVG